MARKLIKAQKTILDTQIAQNIDELSKEVLKDLEVIHNYETLYQDVDRYLMDRAFVKLCKQD
jgi:hypothetical protein